MWSLTFRFVLLRLYFRCRPFQSKSIALFLFKARNPSMTCLYRILIRTWMDQHKCMCGIVNVIYIDHDIIRYSIYPWGVGLCGCSLFRSDLKSDICIHKQLDSAVEKLSGDCGANHPLCNWDTRVGESGSCRNKSASAGSSLTPRPPLLVSSC